MIDLTTALKEKAAAIAPQLKLWRETLHRNPELGFDLAFTKQYVHDELVKLGCEPVACGKSGWTVLLGKGGGKTILLRADMDALPLTEDTGEIFSSEVAGKMHACGHDLHTAMLLGAAKLLKENEELLEGQVKLMFQPAEEIGSGAKDMVAAGVLEAPKVDAAVMIHVAAGVPFPTGMMLVPEGGAGASASTRFVITAAGRGGHGSMPAKAINPITAICHINTALNEIAACENELTQYLAISIGQIQGGSAGNVIPDTAMMSGTIRAMSAEVQSWAEKRIEEIATAVGRAYRTEVTVEYPFSIPPMLADDHVSQDVTKYLRELYSEKMIVSVSKKQAGGGSEDFASVTNRVPGIALILASGNSNEGYTYSAHNAKVRFDEAGLPLGTAAHVYLAIRWLQEHN